MATTTNKDLNVRLRLTDSGFTSGASKMSGVAQKLGKQMEKIGQTMTVGLTLPIVGFGIATLKTAGDFEKGMNRVKALTGASVDEFQKLRDQAKKLGAETEFSATQAAEGMQELAQAGFKTNQIMQAMPGVLDLAAAAGIELGRAADITSSIMAQFGIKAAKAGDIADLLAKSANTSNQSIDDLADAMNYLGPTAKAMGIKLEEAAAIAGIMSDNGLKGSLGTRAFGTSLVRIAKPTKAAQSLMADLNLEFFTAKGEYKDLAGIVGELDKAFKGLTTKEKQEALGTIFGAESIQEWNILLKKGEGGIRSYTKELENYKGAASETARIQREGLNGEMEKLSSSVEGLMIAIGDSGLLTAVTDIITKFTEWVNWFAGLDKATQGSILMAAGLVAAIGPVIGVINKTFTAVSSVKTAFDLAKGGLMAFQAAGVGIGGAFAITAAIIAMGAWIAYVITKLWEMKAAQDAVLAAAEVRNNIWKNAGFSSEVELRDTASKAKGLTAKQQTQIRNKLNKSGLTGAARSQESARLIRKYTKSNVQRKADGGLIYAAGGMFSRRGTDSVPAMLTPGEAVMSKDAVEKFAKGESGNMVINVDLSNSVVSNDLLKKMAMMVEQAVNRKSELNTFGLS